MLSRSELLKKSKDACMLGNYNLHHSDFMMVEELRVILRSAPSDIG